MNNEERRIAYNLINCINANGLDVTGPIIRNLSFLFCRNCPQANSVRVARFVESRVPLTIKDSVFDDFTEN